MTPSRIRLSDPKAYSAALDEDDVSDGCPAQKEERSGAGAPTFTCLSALDRYRLPALTAMRLIPAERPEA